MLHRLFKVITSKIFVACFIILIQIFLALLTFYLLQKRFMIWRIVLTLTSIIATLHIINKDSDATFKLGWLTLLLVQPFIGTVFYIMFSNHRIPKRLRNLVKKEKSESNIAYYHDDSEFLSDIKKYDLSYFRSFNYLSNVAGFPIYNNTKTNYLPSGEKKVKLMLQELKKAKKFILLEYFIIDRGMVWDSILEILIEKVNEGVEVFVMYDDMGCLNSLPPFYDEYLQSLGIKCRVFNPIRITAAINMNYRNHRKLCIVDGRIAITGGINLADEYANLKRRFGHWRDSGVYIEGKAVWTFTLAFLRFFSYLSNEEIDYFKYQYHFEEEVITDGYVVPYCDSPTDAENVGHSAHMNMIINAKKYLYIQSPYVVLDQDMFNALILASKSGVDVRIMIPHIPDKKAVYIITKNNCRKLMKHGVKIYEYTPGFVHAKTFVSDDKCALVGTVNMDYRSYYLHYECGVYFYCNHAVEEVKDDFLNTLSKCQEVSYEAYNHVSVKEKIIRIILNIFSPIL